jgi:hypothetical protein
MAANNMGWDREDLTLEDVQQGLAHGRDPDADANGRLMEHVLELGDRPKPEEQDPGVFKRALVIHDTVTTWRMAHGRKETVQEGKLILAGRLLAMGHLTAAHRVLAPVKPDQWATHRSGLVPHWMRALTDLAKRRWESNLYPKEIHAITRVLNSRPWQPWLHRPGPDGASESWDILRWTGLAALGPIMPVGAGLMVMPDTKGGTVPSNLGKALWTWLTTTHGSAPDAIVAHYAQLADHWRVENVAGIDKPTRERWDVAAWLRAANLISDPGNAILSSVTLTDQLWKTVPDLAEGFEQVRQSEAVYVGIKGVLFNTLEDWLGHPKDALTAAEADARALWYWRTLPGPSQVGSDPNVKAAVPALWQSLLVTHPEWVHTRPLPPLVEADLDNPRHPSLQAIFRQAQARPVASPHPATEEEPGHRRRRLRT